jgi:tetratricopeptide (TPR) repeat protein
MSSVRARRVAFAVAAALVAASSAGAQSTAPDGGRTIDDSLFLPIRLPEAMAFGYPPNEIFLPRIIELVRRRQFDSLDTMYDGLAADVRRDVRNEIRFSDAFDAADRNDPALLADIDAWIAARPRSAHARVARATYHLATAWRRRGHAYLRDTPPENIRGMVEFAKKSIDDVAAALQIDSTHLVAYEKGIAVMQMAGTHQGAFLLMARGLAIHRGSYGLANSFIGMLWPRWGGTETMIMEVAERAIEDSAFNPRLVTLRGAVNQTRAYDSSLARNYAGAVRELNKALAYGPERLFLADRGKAYYRLQAYEYAFHDLRAVMMESSQDEDVLDYYGRTLIELATRARPAIRPTILDRAIEVLTLATYLDPSKPTSRTALGRARRMAGK